MVRAGFEKTNKSTISNFLLNKNTEIHALGLLYDHMNSFKEISFPNKKNFQPINEQMVETLSKYLIDLVIYGERAQCDKCEIIEKIHKDFSKRKYMLRELQSNMNGRDISLNRHTFIR